MKKPILYSFILLVQIFTLVLSATESPYPKDFKWGAAIAEFQNSGALRLPNSNWANFEQSVDAQGKPYIKDAQRSGYSVNHWDKYQQDIELMKSINLNSFRFSIDWSSIEPQEGKFDQQALQHYVDLCDALNKAGITPMATLHHFTHPIWFDDKGGWEEEKNIKFFVRFCKLVFEILHNKIPLWCTINEPAIYAFTGYLLGIHSPGKNIRNSSFKPAGKVLRNLLNAHVQVYQELKTMPGGDKAQIGIVHNVLKFAPRYWWEPLERTICSTFTKITNDITMDFLRTGQFKYKPFFCCDTVECENDDAPNSYDFVGLNYYATAVIGFNGENIFGATCFPGQTMGDMDLPLDPEGFGEALNEVASLGKPVYVTENGVADKGDSKRIQVLEDYLGVIKEKISHGMDIRGYYHWTLVNNFEWHEGWEPQFGLFTKQRTMRESASYFKDYIISQSSSCKARSNTYS